MTIQFFIAFAILFQPEFQWADRSTTQQGTGSFVRASNGKVIGLTSAHFIDFSGPRLLKADWLDIKSGKSIATTTRSWGKPGRAGSYEPLDLRPDYLLLVMEGDIDPQSILEIDSRNLAEVGERVLFPNKNGDVSAGTIQEAKDTYLIVKLDKKVNLEARSGTPILSQSTGKIIGLLTGGSIESDHTLLYLTPSSGILKMLSKDQECCPLRDVVGQ